MSHGQERYWNKVITIQTSKFFLFHDIKRSINTYKVINLILLFYQTGSVRKIILFSFKGPKPV